MELALKKYSKPLRFLFGKYCFSTGVHAKNTLFKEIQSEYQTCTFAEIWKMCREYDLAEYLSKEEAQNFVKKINTKALNKAEINNLDYEGFKSFIINVAHFRATKLKLINNNYLIGHGIDQLFQVIATAAKKQGQSTLMFEDPEALMINADPELMKNLNKQLQANPDHPVPDNYRKVVEKQLSVDYQINKPVGEQIGESWVTSYEIINDIVRKNFGGNVLEPFVTAVKVTKCKPKDMPAALAQQMRTNKNMDSNAPKRSDN